jgi:hypothetical protein
MSGILGNDITEQYLNKCYEDFSKEQMRLLNDMKNSGGETEEKDKELDIQRQLTQLNSLMIGVLRFRNLRKKVAIKGNSV